MNLKNTGTIQVDGYNVRRTNNNQWLITKKGTVITYVDTLAEVYPAIDCYTAKVRARAAKAEVDAAQIKEQASRDQTLLDFHPTVTRSPMKQSDIHLGGGNVMSL